jgi:quinol monooxygenase YgiN/predicted GNAT family acetyltransferase
MAELQLIARYTVTFGNELEVASLLAQFGEATRAEPGNLSSAVYRKLDDERDLVLLERYASLDALNAHRASAHYQDLLLDQIVPRLDSRVVEIYDVDRASQFLPATGAAEPVEPSGPAGYTELPVQVRENTESQTYDALIGDDIAGTLLYEHEGPRLVLTHTAVQPRYQHKGVATALVAAALDDIRSKGIKITILCPQVKSFIQDHPDYADLVDAEHPGLAR